jgi:hypothetical protein
MEALTQDQINFAIKCMAKWIHIRWDNEFGNPNPADVSHSALLHRLLSGKEPLDKPPPKSYSYPDYPMAEGEAVQVDEPRASTYDDDGYNIVVNQSRAWKWIDEEKGILEHKTWGRFRTWIQDEQQQIALGPGIFPVRKLQKISEGEQGA